jgi:hypothetical protein
MRRVQHREPRWWRLAGALGMVLGLAFWTAVIVVAWHFIEKYW